MVFLFANSLNIGFKMLFLLPVSLKLDFKCCFYLPVSTTLDFKGVCEKLTHLLYVNNLIYKLVVGLHL